MSETSTGTAGTTGPARRRIGLYVDWVRVHEDYMSSGMNKSRYYRERLGKVVSELLGVREIPCVDCMKRHFRAIEVLGEEAYRDTYGPPQEAGFKESVYAEYQSSGMRKAEFVNWITQERGVCRSTVYRILRQFQELPDEESEEEADSDGRRVPVTDLDEVMGAQGGSWAEESDEGEREVKICIPGRAYISFSSAHPERSVALILKSLD